MLEADVSIRSPRKKVWGTLTDQNQLGQCVPGVETNEIIEPKKKYRGVVSVGFGGMKARFNGEVGVSLSKVGTAHRSE